jgi:hypothetical protein
MSFETLASPFEAVGLVVRVGSIGVAISSLELLSHRTDLGGGGVLDAEVQLTRVSWLVRTRWRHLLVLLSGDTATAAIVALRLVAACVLIGAAEIFEVARFGAVVVAATTLLLRLRSPIGIHASGSMVMVTFTACGLGLAVGTTTSMGFALAFVGGQACLSYFVAGSTKLREPSWRAGTAVPLIMATQMWGRRREALILGSHRELGLALCWVTMLGECSVPLSLVVPLPVALGILACAASFHIATAVEMGLNSFVWAFGSTYPAIIFCWYWLHGVHA